jgi:hypothetical protein
MPAPILMLHTGGETAVAFRERKPIATARHSAAGAAALATPVVAGVHALRVRAVGVVAAVVAAGADVAEAVSVAGGSEGV